MRVGVGQEHSRQSRGPGGLRAPWGTVPAVSGGKGPEEESLLKPDAPEFSLARMF